MSLLNSLFARASLYMGIELVNIDWFEEIFEILELSYNGICRTMFGRWLECLLIEAGSSFGFL